MAGQITSWADSQTRAAEILARVKRHSSSLAAAGPGRLTGTGVAAMTVVGAARVDDRWLTSARTRNALVDLDRRMKDALVSRDPGLETMATALLDRGGKRIRPALLLVAGEFGAFRLDRLLDAAAALELLHLATLYHDDVLDRAVKRRHGPSANAQWGDPSALVTGTFLVARASALIATFDDGYGRDVARALVALCTGQLRETENAFHTSLTEDEYHEDHRG